MTEATMHSMMAAVPGDVPSDITAPDELPPQTSLARQALADTFSSWQARAGAAWIAVVGLCAVFAPLLANSYPFVAKIGGRWSSPLYRHLTATDVILLVATAAAVVLLLIRRMSWAFRAMAFAVVLALLIPLAFLIVHPPLTEVFSEYRELARDGNVQWALYAPIPYSANDRSRDEMGASLNPPSSKHPLGTEVNGGDVLSRMIHACRIAMAIGFISMGIAFIIGVVIGGIMGYFVGTLDILGMRVIEVFEAIPTLFLLITFVAYFGHNLYIMMAIIGLTTWTGDARFIRAEFLRLRQQDFVQAARAAGLPVWSIVFRHMLPNGITPVLVSASFGIAAAILYESTLSFLGLGLVDEPSWGQLLNQSLSVGGTFTWWMAFYPGLAIFLTVFAYNLIGESLRDALDPRLHGIK